VLTISKQELQINEEIRDKEVLLIDVDGTKLGVISARDAQKMAYEKDLDLVKILNSKDSTVTRLTGAEFDLYKKDGNTYSKVNTEPIVIDNDQQEEALRNLSSGQYYLEETKAPDGCTLLADQIYFRQENGTIILTDEDGNALQTENAMWSLSSSDGSNVLTIKNNKIYNLPSAGGPGIYGFTISGVAILATALLLFIKNKRREEEAKRS